MQTETADQVFTFGGFTLDLRKGLLHRDDEPVFLRPKAHALLIHLAQNIGRVVPKGTALAKAREIAAMVCAIGTPRTQ